MSSYVLIVGDIQDFTKGQLYKCTVPVSRQHESRVYVDSINNNDDFSSLSVNERVVLFINVPEKIEEYLLATYPFRDSNMYGML